MQAGMQQHVGLEQQQLRPRVFYLRDNTGFPVACVASQQRERVVEFAVAVYNPKYPCDRGMARQVAVGRLHKGRVQWVDEGPAEAKRAILMAIAYGAEVVYHGHIRDAAGAPMPATFKAAPARVRRAAKGWLAHREHVGVYGLITCYWCRAEEARQLKAARGRPQES